MKRSMIVGRDACESPRFARDDGQFQGAPSLRGAKRRSNRGTAGLWRRRWIAHMGIGWSRVCAGSPGMRREGVRMGPCLLGGARREGNTKSRMRLWRTACGGGLQGRP